MRHSNRRAKWSHLVLMLITSLFLTTRIAHTDVEPPDPYFPESSQHHFQLADKYQAKAVEYRKDAEEHRKMADQCELNCKKKELSKVSIARILRLEKFCRDYAKQADKLAKRSEENAVFHREIGKELEMQGK